MDEIITNEEYQAYAEAMAKRDMQSVTEGLEILNDVIENLKSSVDAINDLRNSMPPISSTLMQNNARGQIENLYNQTNSLYQQLGYTKQNFDSIVTQYTNPAPNPAQPGSPPPAYPAP